MRTLAVRTTRQGLDFEQYDFGGGINIQDSPQKLSDNDLTIADNMYLSTEGDVQTRKGINVNGTAVGGAGLGARGGIRFYQEIANGTVSSNKISLMQVGSSLYNADTGALIGTAGQLGASALPWSAERVFDPNHVVQPPVAPVLGAPTAGGTLAAGTYLVSTTYTTTGGETLNGPDASVTVTANQEFLINSPPAVPGVTGWRPYVSAANGATGTEISQSASIPIGTNYLVTAVGSGGARPVNNTAVAACDILVICTGSGGPYAYDGTALYTLPSGPTSVAGARWCKNINSVLFFAGFTSQPNLVVASYVGQPENLPGYGTFAMTSDVAGLGTLGQGLQTSLVVGLAAGGISLLSGFTPNSYVQQDIPMNDAVASGRSMITVDGVLYFVGNFGIYRYDGTRFVEISRKVRPWILNDPQHQEHPMNGDRSQTWAMYWNRRIYFWYSAAATPTVTDTALVWDLERQGWTIYKSGVPLGAGFPMDAPTDPDPWTFEVIGLNTGQKYDFDVYADNAYSISDAGTLIPSQWQSKFFKIGTGGSPKTLKRLRVELFSPNFSGSFTVATDYGVASSFVQTINASAGGAVFDTAQFDISQFAIEVGYSNTRVDTNLRAEAFAFGAVSPPSGMTPATLTGARFMGVTGRFIQETKT